MIVEAWVTGILATVVRVGGCFLVLPGLSSARIPAPARIYVTLSVAVAIALARNAPAPAIADGFALLRLVAAEMAVGLSLGLAVRFTMLALSFAATTIATVIGFNNLFGQGVEDTESQAALTTMVTFAALIMLFALDFHHHVIAALYRSYTVFPVGRMPDPSMMVADMAGLLDHAFTMVLGLAAPFLVYALVFNTAIGVLNKLTPQIPIFFVSLPALIAGGLLLLYLAIPQLLSLFTQGFLDNPVLR